MSATIRVFTRMVSAEDYPEGLARAIHFACEMEGEKEQALNRNYGMLFAKGSITKENTIRPMGVVNPKLFAMADGTIGVIGERVLEDGTPDETAAGKVLMWKTRDLIHFAQEELVPLEEVKQWEPAEVLTVGEEIARQACLYWNPVTCTKVRVPKEIEVQKEQELDAVRAQVLYSDGSQRDKKVLWDKAGIQWNVPGEYVITGRITQQRFSFPLAKGYGDPVIFAWEGKWYYIATNDNLNDIGFYVREAETVAGLFAEGVEEHLILAFDPERALEQTFWAPEFHVIGGELYILFAVSGHAWGPQCHLMKKKKGASICKAESWEDPVRVCRMDGRPLAESGITLDMTYVKAQSGSYVIWSYREHICSPLDTGSMLYIASVDEKEPWKLTSEPMLLSRPLYGWENVSGTINNEGPYAFVKDGTVYVTYSGGAANGYTYALGLLKARSDADLTQLSSWTKSIAPVLTFYSVKGEYGPGHNSFYENEEGELMIAYHGETDLKDHLRCDGIRRVHFRADGTPYFQMAAWEDMADTEVQVKVLVK